MEDKKEVIIYGTGLHAEEISYYFKYYGIREPVAFTVENAYYDKKKLMGLPVIPFEDITAYYPPTQFLMFIAIGMQNVNQSRERLFKEAKSKGYSIAECVSKNNLFMDDTSIGEGNFIEASKFQPFVKIGDNINIVDSGVAHHVKIKSHAFITGSTIGGASIIEKNAVIGIGSIIAPKVRVGAYSVIGMGSTITKDVEPYSVYTNNTTRKRNINSTKLKLLR